MVIKKFLRKLNLNSKKDKVFESFKKDFNSIKKKGFIASLRKHNTGIGKTFEELVGVTENNNLLVDYKDVLELKSSREISKSSLITLFTKSPSHPKGVNSYLRKKYGQVDKKSNLKTLHTTVSNIKFNTFFNKFGFKLFIDKTNKRIILLIKDLEKDVIIDESIYYNFKDIKNIVNKKCKYIAFISAESKKEEGKEFFNFKKSWLLKGLTFKKFLNFIKKGYIVYDIRIGVYRSGKNKGKTHDHGSGFRVFKNKLKKVFKIKEI